MGVINEVAGGTSPEHGVEFFWGVKSDFNCKVLEQVKAKLLREKKNSRFL